MENLIIRTGIEEDFELITEYLKKMLVDMSTYGGYKVINKKKNWDEVKDYVKSKLNNYEYIYRIIEDKSISKAVAFSEAKILELDDVFEPLLQLHISCIYVIDEYRKKGLGKYLIEDLVQIAKDNNCQELELNVLVNSPAHFLYKSMGFNDFRMNMRKPV